MPVYNEWAVLPEVMANAIDVLKDSGVEIVLVDDGSHESGEEETFHHSCAFVTCLRHPVNSGVGAAIGTGMEYARKFGARYVVTMDGDGQHDAKDVLSLFRELEKGEANIVNGSRFLKRQSIPWFRRLANQCGNLINFLLSGYWVSDSQSGMKGFGPQAIHEMKDLSPGYEWCLDVFRVANWRGWRVSEVPISVNYSSYSLRKGQGIAVGLDMVMRLIVRAFIRSFRI